VNEVVHLVRDVSMASNTPVVGELLNVFEADSKMRVKKDRAIADAQET
jgi:hypothetical protein